MTDQPARPTTIADRILATIQRHRLDRYDEPDVIVLTADERAELARHPSYPGAPREPDIVFGIPIVPAEVVDLLLGLDSTRHVTVQTLALEGGHLEDVVLPMLDTRCWARPDTTEDATDA